MPTAAPSRSDSPTRTCTEPGCGKPLRARGLCSTHYNQQHQTPEQRHAQVTVACGYCSTPCSKGKGRTERYASVFCSLLCRDLWRIEQPDDPMYRPRRPVTSTALVRVECWSTPVPAGHPARQTVTPPRAWAAGSCTWCGQPFVSQWLTNRTCSTRCARAQAKHAHRVRKGHARLDMTRRQRVAIYERDGWQCWLCCGPVDATLMDTDRSNDWAPSLDHVVPRAQGGSDHPNNLRLAHRWCNAVRGDERYYTAADLRPDAAHTA